ncbi:flavin-containing monooxygenase FMO GS-OX-like 2 [Impatiens glandulifera]|uniref:flavin-containing monooxygenase FMO GS-OX-like 2 n=1 Tax=Impatiens glandulifera TaxID=253017 RepID=UPI001FB15500|nr:flavin-containing monooxygenase FMO GS-OX-like 2 [Impatiens glandulifera]
MIGNGPSAMDISKDVATVAKEVHLSSRSPNTIISKLNGYDNLWQHSEIDFNDGERGIVIFKDGSSVHPDVIFHCTGYKFDFPFLKTNGIVTVDDKRVGPLYKHVFAPEFGPSLSFLGLNNFGIPCRIIELQAKWVAKVLSGFAVLPSKEEMMEDVKEYYKKMEESGIPKHHTHRLEWKTSEYIDWLATEIGIPTMEDRLKQMFYDILSLVLSRSNSSLDVQLRDS